MKKPTQRDLKHTEKNIDVSLLISIALLCMLCFYTLGEAHSERHELYLIKSMYCHMPNHETGACQ